MSTTTAPLKEEPPSPNPPHHEPSPSPPPEPPTALTPGPRAQALITLYSKTLSATLSSISYSAFASCFPGIAERAPEVLRWTHGQMVGKLEEHAHKEFSSILAERNIIQYLNKLELILSDARRRKSRSTPNEEVIPPHQVSPDELLKANLYPHLLAQRSLLNAKLQTIESLNAGLVERLKEQKGEIDGLMGELEAVAGDLGGAGERVGEEGEGLAMEGREVEGILSGI